ncbi:MAG: hypothetical protein HZA04_04330 [Nitrospinae bacterium]|nr:hypothetical protein [Nitrospinota bacterium]
MESRITELSARVERLSKDLVAVNKDVARLRRLLLAAEAKIKELSAPGGNGNGEGANILELTRQVEKFKQERKTIKDKVEKMSAKLEKFYQGE